MAKQNPLLVIIIIASILYATSSSLAVAETVYDVLEKNNLPRGLLPQGVKSYVLHAGGALDVTLPGECDFDVSVAGKQFKFRYASSVSGVIASGSISRVSGVRVQAGFAWLGFTQVTRAGNELNIQLEKSTQSFPVSAFAQSPRCS